MGKRLMAMLTLAVLLFTNPAPSFAAERRSEISPAYSYTKKVSATLSISTEGIATCGGSVKAMASSRISLTMTLYKKAGNVWSKVTSWSTSGTGITLKLQKTYAVSKGTYKVAVAGTVTSSEGNSEHFSETSTQITYAP